jgi:LPS export ABC transporter protein LptC/lipopolysaccharide transport protein LptA
VNRWQRRARLLIAVFAIAFAIVVFRAFKGRTPPPPPARPVATPPGSVLQSTGGHIVRTTGAREDVSISYQQQVTFNDNTTKLLGVTIVSKERNGSRTFTITGKEGRAGKDGGSYSLDGDVRLVASDGLTVRTEHATYTDTDGTVRADGPVQFGRERFDGSGVGMTYDKTHDALTIVNAAVVHVKGDRNGEGAADVTAGTATFARREKTIRFDRGLHVQRPAQTIDADAGTATLSDDEKRIRTLEAVGSARIQATDAGVGGLQQLAGQTIDLEYAPDGQALRHAKIVGGAGAQLAGQAGKAGRQIAAETLDIALAPDGTTPTALNARDHVHLTIPADGDTSARTIASDIMDGTGQAGRGLTRARFQGNVDYRESGGSTGRAARSGVLDAALQPGLNDIENARFSGNVRFEQGTMAATGATARYDLGKGTLELTGTDRQPPHMVNERISVDADHMNVTLVGPKVAASGNVKSVLQPPRKGQPGETAKVPSMLKQDQPVNVTSGDLSYDGAVSKAVYGGDAVLWQGETSVKGVSLTVDDKTGDLTAAGPATTTTMLQQQDSNKKKERVRSIGTAANFKYEDAPRRATYTGDAHLSGPQGDMTAAKIELYLKESGDEVDRLEAYAAESETVVIREQNRKTTGTRLTYTSADDRYVVAGKPAVNVDACGNQSSGGTLIFVKATDTIIVDGNGYRTETKSSGGSCK